MANILNMKNKAKMNHIRKSRSKDVQSLIGFADEIIDNKTENSDEMGLKERRFIRNKLDKANLALEVFDLVDGQGCGKTGKVIIKHTITSKKNKKKYIK